MPNKPNVVTQDKSGNVWINAKLYKQTGDPSAASQEVNKLLNNPYQKYILGDTGGETYRKYYTASGADKNASDSSGISTKELATTTTGPTGKTFAQGYSDVIASNPNLKDYFGQGGTTKEMETATKQLMLENIATQMGDKSVIGSEAARRVFGDIGTGLDDETQKLMEGQAQIDGPPPEMQQQFQPTPDFQMQMPQQLQQTGGVDLSSYGIPADTPSDSLTPEQKRLYEGIQKLNQETFDSTVQEIQRWVQEQTAAVKTEQEKAMGASRVALARMGALQTTSAATQYVNDLQSEYTDKLSGIVQQGISAINTAQRAKSEGDLEILSQQIENIRQNKQDMMAEQAQFMDNLQAMENIAKLRRDSVTGQIDAMVASGMTEDDVPEGYLGYLDSAAGYAPGVSAGLMQMAERERSIQEFQTMQEAESASIQRTSDLIDLLNKVPYGQSIEINGSVYTGMDNGMEFKGYEIDKTTGDGVAVVWDKNSGGLMTHKMPGMVSPQMNYQTTWVENGDGTKTLWYVPENPNAGIAVPVPGAYSSNATGGVGENALMSDFPQGESFSNTSWCGEYLRNIMDEGVLPPVGNFDTIQQKREWADETIGFGPGQRPPQVGDIIVTNEHATYGHVGMITDITVDPNTGRQVARLAESNYSGPYPTYTRTIELSENNMETAGGKVIGFHTGKLKPEYTQEWYSTPGLTAVGGEEIDWQQVGKEQNLFGKFEGNDTVQRFVDVQNKAGTFNQIIDMGVGGPGDLALVFEFMKALDPTSVVRESEYEAAAKSGNIFAGSFARFNGYLKEEGGFLPDNVKNSFNDMVQAKYGQANKEFENVYNSYRTMAVNQGLNPDNVVLDYRLESPVEENQSAMVTNPYSSTDQMKNEFGDLPGVSEWIDSMEDQGLNVDQIYQLLMFE